MRFTVISFAVLMIATVTAFAQQEADIGDIKKLTIIHPGFTYEKRIAPVQSLTVFGGAQISAYFTWSDYFGSDAGVNLNPAIELGYRYYYNVARRSAKGKRTEMNSANYLGAIHQSSLVRVWTYDSSDKHRLFNSIGLLWGMQRNYSKRFSLDFQAGLGYRYGNLYVSSDESRVFFITGVHIGFWLNRRQ